MKKFFKSFLAAFIAVIALAFAACGGIFEGNIGISDNVKTKTENAVRLLYETDDSIKNGYEMKCKIRAEKALDECEEEIVSAPKIDVTQIEKGKDFIFPAQPKI